MRKIILAAAAVTALLCVGAPAKRAVAMTVATPTALGVTAPDFKAVQDVRWGWHRHWGLGWRRRPWIGGGPVYWGYRPYYRVRPWWPGPWAPYNPGWGPPAPWAPWGACCYWGWHRPWGGYRHW